MQKVRGSSPLRSTMKSSHYHVIGVAGGSGSGKTTIATKLSELVGKDRSVLIPFDAYYNDQSSKNMEDRKKTNYDHPDSLEASLLSHHLAELLAGRTIQQPVYDFTTHTRSAETITVAPQKIIIVEGILLFSYPELVSLFDLKVFVDTPDDIRFIRRLQRDQTERGRTVQEVIDQYQKTVRPMHLAFVEPSKQHADIIVPEGGFNNVALELLSSALIHTHLTEPS